VASIRGFTSAFIVQYDLDTDQLEEVAGDAFGNRDDQQEGDSSVRPRRPVYSEDGNCLYYVSMDQHVMRVDLGTGRSEKLPFTNAIAVLTVRGEHLVYAREVVKGREPQFAIVNVRLHATDDSHSQPIYIAKGVLWGNFVSPSRRFILFEAMAGYSYLVRVVDVDRGTTYGAWGLLGEGDFRPQSTVFVESCP
jgi:hypothetical protein